MSTRLCLFGVSKATDDSAIIDAVKGVFRTYDTLPGPVYVGIQSKAAAKERRFFYLLVGGGLSWTFETMSRHLARAFPEMTSILYHDGWGVFKFEHREKAENGAPKLVLGINTVGPYIEVYAGKLAKSYPQSGFTDDELRALHEKNPDDMTEAECKAVMEYKHAVDIGINELFPEDGRRYIKVGYEKSFTPVVLDGAVVASKVAAVKESDLPRGVSNFPSEWEGSIYS
jgi:hypothetical protein